MNQARKGEILKSLRYWAASYALVAGFLFYKSTASWQAVLIAGILTFAVTVGRAILKKLPADSSY